MIAWWKSIKVENKYINRGLNEVLAGAGVLFVVINYLVYNQLAH